MKSSLSVSNFLEEISSLSHSIIFPICLRGSLRKSSLRLQQCLGQVRVIVPLVSGSAITYLIACESEETIPMCLSRSCSFGSDGRDLGAVTHIVSGRSVKQGPVQQTPSYWRDC